MRTYALVTKDGPMSAFPIYMATLHMGFTDYYVNLCHMGSLQWGSGTCCSGLRVDRKGLWEGGWTRMGVLMGLIVNHVAGDLVCAYSDMGG